MKIATSPSAIKAATVLSTLLCVGLAGCEVRSEELAEPGDDVAEVAAPGAQAFAAPADDEDSAGGVFAMHAAEIEETSARGRLQRGGRR